MQLRGTHTLERHCYTVERNCHPGLDPGSSQKNSRQLFFYSWAPHRVRGDRDVIYFLLVNFDPELFSKRDSLEVCGVSAWVDKNVEFIMRFACTH